MDDQEKQEHVDNAIGQIRALFRVAPVEGRDYFWVGTLIRVKFKNGGVHTWERKPNPIGHRQDVWRSAVYESMTWPNLLEWIRKNAQHIAWVRMVDHDTLSMTQIYPEPDPEPEETFDPNQVIEGIVYQAYAGEALLGRAVTFNGARELINKHWWGTEFSWTRINAFAWKPDVEDNDPVDGYLIQRVRRGL